MASKEEVQFKLLPVADTKEKKDDQQGKCENKTINADGVLEEGSNKNCLLHQEGKGKAIFYMSFIYLLMHLLFQTIKVRKSARAMFLFIYLCIYFNLS